MTRLATLLALMTLAACASSGASTEVGPDAGHDTIAPDSPGDLAPDLRPDAAEPSPDGAEGLSDTPSPEPDEVGADPGPDVPGDAPADTADATPDTPTDTAPDDWHLQYGTPCPLDARVGLFEIGVDSYGLAAVTGYVADRVNPLQVLVPKATEGPCTLLERPNPFCDPPCTGSQQCAPGNQCVPFPTNQDAGTVTITGLAMPVTLAPDALKTYTKTDFDAVPFAPGANLELTAESGPIGSFALQGEGVALLELPSKTWAFHAGDPVTIAWTPGTGVGTIRLSLNVDQHGVTPVTLVCDVPDTGSFEVPGGLTQALWSYGVSGAPSSSIVRRTVDSVEVGAGCVELLVSHRVKTLIKVQ